MASTLDKTITVSVTVNMNLDKTWELFTNPWHIIHWYQASDDWHTARAENDVKKYGRFLFRMEARDCSFGFDFSGEYRKVKHHETIECFLDDARKVTIKFDSNKDGTLLTESFEPEHTFPKDYQKAGWQSILNNFKKYAEEAKRFNVLHFEVLIDSTVENVFKTMLESETFKTWTSVFNPSSRYEGSWDKGSKIIFLGEDKIGNTGGMVSWIKDNIPDKSIKIEHQGVIKEGKEIMSGQDVDTAIGSLESYIFKSVDGKTLLSVDMDTTKEFKSYFEKTWPEALNKLKSICEK